MRAAGIKSAAFGREGESCAGGEERSGGDTNCGRS